MLRAPNLAPFEWLAHGFGQRDSDSPGDVATLRQIHSGTVREATPACGDRFDEGDALISAQPGVIVGIRTADCVPILLADQRTRAVAAAHAGWRGTAQNIAGSVVNEMRKRFGSRVEDLHAAVGPSIGPCCYEVGADVARQFGTWCPDLDSASGPVRLDLPAINKVQLSAIGVPDIWVAGECTFCLPERYFSFRREKEQAGRMLSFIGLR
jgi:hypothetical protein